MHTDAHNEKDEHNKRQETLRVSIVYLLTSYVSGKSAKLCKHVIALICLIREHHRNREIFEVRGRPRNLVLPLWSS